MEAFGIPKYDEVVAFRATLTPESDRGCVLIAAAYIDSQLKDLTEAHFIDNKSCSEELLGQSKPLGTFSARIDVCFAMGLLPTEVHRDLHLIRKIRNDFGHKSQPITFADPAISSRCRELVSTWHTQEERSRARFCNAVMSILSWIHFRLACAKKPAAPSRVAINAPKLKAEFDSVWQEVIAELDGLVPVPNSFQELIDKVKERVSKEYLRRFCNLDQRHAEPPDGLSDLNKNNESVRGA